jgi:hypothetical protein
MAWAWGKMTGDVSMMVGTAALPDVNLAAPTPAAVAATAVNAAVLKK